MTDQNSGIPKADGESSLSSPKDIVTGNSVEEAGKSVKQNTSENGKLPANYTLPKWIGTNPEILAGQQHDLLALMQSAGWFVYIMPVTASNERTALRITISPPIEHKIGVTGALNDQVITIDNKPVTE